MVRGGGRFAASLVPLVSLSWVDAQCEPRTNANSWIFDVCGLCTTACLTRTHNSLPSRTNAMNFAGCISLLVSYRTLAPQPYFFLPVIYAHESLISWPTYAHSRDEFVTVFSVVCHACFSVGSDAVDASC